MRHTMKLKEDPFERMKNGTKTIEFRLYDEKRRKIKVGDEIEFLKLPKLQERILVRVKNLYRGDYFKNLFKIIFPDKDNKEIGETIAKKVGTLILTGPTSEKIENATKIALIDSPNKSLDIVHCTNLEEAVKIAKQKSNSGDIVLLSPASASFDAFKNFEERGKKFKQLVNEL